MSNFVTIPKREVCVWQPKLTGEERLVENQVLPFELSGLTF